MMDQQSEQTYGPSTDRASELPMEEHHLIAEECVNKLGGRIKHCFRSAFEHLRRSWTLHPVDSEMSLFRAITAEEEAATALILAVKQIGYDGADKLLTWNHVHKSAISPFLDAVNNLLAETKVPTPRLIINRGDRPKIDVTIDLAALLGKAEPEFAMIDHPFNYIIRAGDNPKAHMFVEQLQNLATMKGEQSIEHLVKKEANLRNQLLYANDDGIPHVEFNDSVILKRRDRVYRLALITIGILQTRQHQLFALQCLQAYRAVIGHIVENTLEYEALAQPDGFHTTIVQQPDGSYARSDGYRLNSKITVTGEWLEPMRASLDDK